MQKFLQLFFLLLLGLGFQTANAQLSGTVTVPGTYPTLAAAISALNTSGVSAATTIEVSSDETAPAGGFVINTFTGSSTTNTVAIKAIGTITLTAQTGTTTTTDGVIKFNGADNVTLEGFNIVENAANITTTTQMEWGIAVLSQSATNSSQNITIKNCSVNLNGTVNHTAEIGIYAAHHSATATTSLSPTSAAGTYANLKIIGCNVDNAYTGISIGISGSATNLDANVTVGEMGAGNTITNFGGAATQAYGIRLEYATNANINYNTVDNTAITTHTTTLDGIYNANGTTQNLTVTNNLVKVSRGSATSQMSAIRNIGYTGTVVWNNNEVTGCIAGGSSGVIYYMHNTAAAASLTVNNNNIHDNVLNTTGGTSLFYNTGVVGNLTFNNNTMSNNNKGASTTGTLYAYWNANTATGGTETISGNTVAGLGISGFTGVTYGIYSSTAVAQNRVAENNQISGIITSGTTYCIYLLSGNQNTINNNKVFNITNTGTGTVYGVYNSGNSVNRSGNKVSDISFTGTGGTFYGIYGASTVQNNMNNDTVINMTGNLVTVYAIYVLGSSTGAQIHSNYVDNLNGVNTFGGLYLTGTNITAYNNTVKNITGSSSSSTGTIYGIYCSNTSSVYNLYSNTFENFTNNATTTGSMHGLFSSTSLGTLNAYKNKFINFSNTSGTTCRLNCINIGGGTNVNIYNNLFSDFNGLVSTDGSALNAIHETSTATGTHNYYNNTFRLNGTLSNGGATGIFFNAATSTINCQNNIFDFDVTASDLTRSVSMIRKATAAGAFNYATTSNNNIFYLPNNTNAFYYIEGLTTATPFSGGISPNATPITGTTDAVFNTPCSTTKLLLGGRESATFDEQVTFVNDVPTGTTHAESGGQTIALVTDDINGIARTSPPDIGAYEFSGTAIVSDVVGPAITYTNLLNSICTNSVPFTVSITDASGINTASGTKPRVWFKKSSEPNALPATNTSIDAGWKYVEATNSTSPFTFNLDFSLLNTPVVAADVIQYFVAAQDMAGNVSLNQIVLKNSFCAASVALDTAGFPTATNGRTFTILSSPGIVNTVSSKPSICGSGETILSLTGDPATGAEYQWQSSATMGGIYTDIAGATSSTYNATITNASNKSFQCVVKCSGTPIITSAPIDINYYDPQVLSVTGGTRCGAGTVDLSATVNPTATANWFENATGGTAIATGSTYTTPTISTTKNYYVEATEGGSTVVGGRITATPLGTAANLTNYGLYFVLTEQITLNSVDVFSGTGTAITLALYNSTGTTQLFTTGSVTTTAGIQNTINLGWTLAPGTYRLHEIAMTGTFYRESGTGVVYPTPLGTAGNITGYVTTLTGNPLTSTTTYYYFYNWSVTTGCRSARQVVTATITTPPTITMPANITMCSNDPAQSLTVSSTNTGYSYEWGPAAGLNTTSGATVQALPSTTTPYQVTATDNSGGTFNGCSTLGNVTVTVNEIPTLSETKSSKDTVCFSDNVTFSLLHTGSASGLTYQWQSSANGSTYNDVSGATNSTYTAVIDNATDKFFQCKIYCKGNLALTSTPKEVIVNAPSILTTTGATRCGTGAVTLSATASTSANIRWYEAATGGTSIATGTSFTTPAVVATRDYYVAASLGGGTTTGGLLNGNTTGTSGAGTTNYGIVFDVLAPFTLKSVKIYPISATSASGTVTIDVINSSGTIMHTKTFNVIGSPIGSLVPTTVDLDFALVPGTNYKIRPGSFTGITGLQFEPAASAPGGNYGYPMVVPGLLNIVTSTLTAAPTNTARNDLYYYFYEWVITNGCESPRQPVTVTVTPATAITASPDVTICSNGTGTSLSVTSANQNYAYAWGPSTGLATTTGASVVANPSTTTSYFVTATDSGCENIDTVKVTVNQVPTSIEVQATLDTVCVSDNTTLSLFNAQPYAPTGLDYQWQSSLTGTGYTDIVGANSATYTAAVSSSTERYFRCNLTCLNNPGVISNPKEIIVSDPQVASVTPTTRCGAGTVTLSATSSSPTDVLRWYADLTGGLPLATGNTFTTPIITTSTDYYVSSSNGGSIQPLGLANRVGATTNSGYSDIGLMFNALQSFVLKSVAVYPVATTPSGNVTFTVQLKNSAGTVLQSQVFSLPTSTSPGVKQTIQLNFPVPVGTGHRLVFAGATGGGITGFIRELTSGFTYPYTVPGVASITSAYSGGATASYYYYFYDWQIATGCESGRTLVTATVTPSPNYSITTDKTVCNNGVLPLTVTTGLADYNNFTWSPQTNLYTDAAGTIPYTGGNAATVYFKSANAGNEVILSAASNTVSQCSNVDDITITNLPVPAISSSRQELCISGNADLSLTPNNGYTNATFEWYSNNTLMSGATGSTVNTGTINATTEYKAKVFDTQNALCGEPIFNLIVNNPSVASTTPNSNCPGSTVMLGAVASGSGTLKWYDVATGGTSLATGNTYTTPALSASKTYYVESIEGGGGTQNVGPATISGATGVVGTYYVNFTVSSPLTINSVKCYFNTVGSNFVLNIRNAVGGASVFTYSGTTTINGTATPQTLPINATLQPGNYQMGWTTDPGTYRQSTGGAYPYTLPGVISITGNTFNDPNFFYYFYDWSVSTGCASPRVPVVATINSCPRVNAKVFLNHVNPTTGLMDDYVKTLANFPISDPYAQSGAFNSGFSHVNSGATATTTPTVIGTLGNNAIVDWVFLELRQGASGSTSVVATKVGLLQKDGDIVGMDGVSPIQFNALAGNYYLAVRHRNHTGFRTDAALALNATPTTLNLTNNSVLLYGSFPLNALTTSVSAMNGGDANSDGSIDAFDTITWEIENGLFDDYYLNSDYNLDGSVDAFDSIEWELNNGKYQELD